MFKSLPMLYGVSSKGKIKQWEAAVQGNDDGSATIIIRSGYVDGKITERPKVIRKGKNIGKANETSPFQQAVSQIESSWNGKRDDNYEIIQMDPNNYTPRLMLPQLAKGVGKGKIVYPAFIQPKLNGVCNLAETCLQGPLLPDVMQHHSRGGHLFETLAHLDKWLLAMEMPAPVHGELYVHGWSLQKIGSYTKKIKPDQHLLQYWLYDLADKTMEFEERISLIMIAMTQLGSVARNEGMICPIIFTPTIVVQNYTEAKAYHDDCVQNGFEGAMLKNSDGMYIFQYRSDDIEKMKEYMDEEFEIVGGKEGTGTDEGCVVYRCITESGIEFDARPRGTVEDRKQMLIDLPKDIGNKLTVRFAEWSDDGCPLQPVGIPVAEAVRDYE